MAIIYQVTDILDSADPADEVRTIEAAAENLKQSVIAKYNELRGEAAVPNEQHDRIVLTAGVVIDD